MSSGYSRRRRPAIVRASIRGPRVSGHTATARDPEVCSAAEAVAPERPPACERCRPERNGPSSHYAQTRGLLCWVPDPTPWPSSSANNRGPVPSSGSHVRRHACVWRISFSWQPRSPSEAEVLHLELEPKQFELAPHLLFRKTAVESLTPNRLVLQIQPEEAISLRFGAKIPGPVVQLGAVV